MGKVPKLAKSGCHYNHRNVPHPCVAIATMDIQTQIFFNISCSAFSFLLGYWPIFVCSNILMISSSSLNIGHVF